MAEERRFLSYENSYTIYKSKTAMIAGVLYFSQGYQSTPVLALQFAQANEGDGDQKTFNWETEEKIWYFPNYDRIFEFLDKLNRWKRVIESLKQNKIVDGEEIKSKYGKLADENKISNPLKKKNIYILPRYYNGYFLTVTFTGKISVSLSADELNCLINYVSDFIRDYHKLALLHRTMNILSRGAPVANGSDSGSSQKSYSGKKSTGSSGGGKPQNKPPEQEKDAASGDDDEFNYKIEDLMTGVDNDDPF
jgi:hypothetical protein